MIRDNYYIASCGPALTSEAAPVETICCTSGTTRCFLGAPANRRLPSREIDLPNKSDRSESSFITSNSTENPTFYENRNFDRRIVIVREHKERNVNTCNDLFKDCARELVGGAVRAGLVRHPKLLALVSRENNSKQEKKW